MCLGKALPSLATPGGITLLFTPSDPVVFPNICLSARRHIKKSESKGNSIFLLAVPSIAIQRDAASAPFLYKDY